MTKLLDLGVQHIIGILMEMGTLSEKCVYEAIGSYSTGNLEKDLIFQWSEKLRGLQWEVSDHATELIFRYQPVATDLRYVRSCMEIAYGLSRFGSYAYDIVEMLETMGVTNKCENSAVMEAADITRKMIRLSINAVKNRDEKAVSQLYIMDNSVDALFRSYIGDLITIRTNSNTYFYKDPQCAISGLLILRYLERMADHACYIGDSVHFIVTGDSSPRN